ncbi:hypothetical protein RA210_U10142 [Rubrivivax sp. A210]|uniref:glycosyltransferase family 9 protein n=1 Tax=Rubrivivax sp. A210 TaxID=2772301 RepID=UPI0019197A26|nr:hypothetical protein [Rubrivivax sp. A210]CAD5366072.1 hypothetical protein RA210_U10142 [Rubrivivax sp. A210]
MQIFSLQRGPRAAEIAGIEAPLRPLKLERDDGSVLDTAAAMANLDLVISVDTMVAHLAGALGRPVWLLLPFAPDWRWMLERADSPWYPTLRLFRQPRPGAWGPVVDEVVQALRQFTGAGSSQR